MQLIIFLWFSFPGMNAKKKEAVQGNHKKRA